MYVFTHWCYTGLVRSKYQSSQIYSHSEHDSSRSNGRWDLKKTLAVLMAADKDTQCITKYKVTGLSIAITDVLLILMPKIM